MFDIVSLVHIAGYAGLFAIVFAESGLFFGFFLPGDSLLFTAGFLASQGMFSLPILLVLLFIAAGAGDSVGYAFGRKVGPRIFSRKKSRFFNPEHVARAHEFFLIYGKKAIFLGRFLPIVRTFVPIVAGVAKMPYRDFLSYNIIGGGTWVGLMTLLGYFLGKQIPEADKYLLPIILAIIIISILPTLFHFKKSGKKF